MQSSSGKYFIGLDHVRALAALLVFTWHFIHVTGGEMAPPPVFPLSLFSEGHTGVALFMVLSGYIFAKLLDGKQIMFAAFLWNRFLRLAPLLIVVTLLAALIKYLEAGSSVAYLQDLQSGGIKYLSPQGAWSIAVEFNFYLLLPFLLLASRKWKYALLAVLLAALVLRAVLHAWLGEIQTLAYWTIIGRNDQFVLGIMAFQCRQYITGRHALVAVTLFLFAVFYWYFDALGGFYRNGSYPSASAIWIFLATAEGFAYALAIAWYDTSFVHRTGRISRFVALIGTYSYSIYLLHFFIVFRLSHWIHAHVLDLSNIHVAMLVSVFAFLLMVPLAHLSYTYIEAPFLRFRTRYIRG